MISLLLGRPASELFDKNFKDWFKYPAESVLNSFKDTEFWGLLYFLCDDNGFENKSLSLRKR